MIPGLKAPPEGSLDSGLLLNLDSGLLPGWYLLCPWGLSVQIWASTERRTPRPQGLRDSASVSPVTSGPQPGSSHLKTCRLPVQRSQSGLTAWRGAPRLWGQDPSCLSGSGGPGGPGLMSASPASALWLLGLWVCVFCPRPDPHPPLLTETGAAVRAPGPPLVWRSVTQPRLQRPLSNKVPVAGSGTGSSPARPGADSQSRVWTGR